MIRLSDEDRRQISLILTPSWLSALVAILIALTLSAGAIVVFELSNSSLQQHLLAWQQSKPQPALTTPGQTVENDGNSTLQDSWPLLLIWSLAGLAFYSLAASIVHSIARAEEIRESLDYVNAKPRTVMTSVAEHVALRLFAIILFIGFATAFWSQVVPYGLTAAHAAAADIASLDGGLYALLSFALIAVSIHALTILLRLSMGKARMFSEA